MEAFRTFTDIVQNVVTTGAAIVAGLWVLNRLNRERTDEAALEMTLTSRSSANSANAPPDSYLVLFTVQLANKGKTKIEAKTERLPDGSVFNDGECLKHSCSLQIRGLQAGLAGPQVLDWFEGGPWINTFYGDTAIDVLIDYHNPKKRDAAGKEKLEFWMEPGETYRMGVPVILRPGTYVAKLTFVGADQEQDGWQKFLKEIGIVEKPAPSPDENFWSQIYAFRVPELPETGEL